MKKIYFASVCFVVSIMIFMSTFSLIKDQVGSITLSSLSEANAAEIEGVEIICNSSPGQCWTEGYGWNEYIQNYTYCCYFTGYQTDHCYHLPC